MTRRIGMTIRGVYHNVEGMTEAEIAALKSPHRVGTAFPCPAIHTNTTFMANRDDEFEGDRKVRKHAMDKARAAGVSPTGKRFFHGLVPEGKPYDPSGWVSEGDAKAEIKRKCELNRFNCEGLVTSKVPGIEPADELSQPDTMGLAGG